jgi:hypothetical protein
MLRELSMGPGPPEGALPSPMHHSDDPNNYLG